MVKAFMSTVLASALSRFQERSDGAGHPVHVFEQSTEELEHLIQRNQPVRLLQTAPGAALVAPGVAKRGGPPVRLEENYLYSTRRFAAGAISPMEYRFFTFAVGADPASGGFQAGITNVSELETNLDVASVVPFGKNFVFRQVGISFNSDVIAVDAATLMEAGWLRFSKQGDQFGLRHGPAAMWPGGTGVGYSTAAATASGNGVADIRAVRSLRVPRVIKAQENFLYSYVVPRAVRNTETSTTISLTNPSIVRVWLWGGQTDTIPG